MKAYYDQRYADYYNGSSAGLSFRKRWHNEKITITPWLKEKSQAAALKKYL